MEPNWLGEAPLLAHDAFCAAARHLDELRTQPLRRQQALFLDQLAALARLRQECVPGATPAAFPEEIETGPEGVEGRLRELFSATDSLSCGEVQKLSKQLGICGDTIRSFIYKHQVELEQVIESCRLECPVPSKVIDRGTAMRSTVPVQKAQITEGSTHAKADTVSEPVPPCLKQALRSGKRRLNTLDGSERDEGEVGGKRSCRRSSQVSLNQAEAGSDAAQTSSNRDNEKILRLRDLQSSSGGLKDAAGAGSILMVMREETSFVVRAALLTIIQQTHKDAFLEGLVGSNFMFCNIMEKWITDGTKQHKTDFLKQLVSVLGHLPLKQGHIKNSKIQSLIARLANKYADHELNRTAGELVNRYQNLRQGLSPGGQAKTHAHGSVLERLHSGEAQQKGKAFFLSSDELRRPAKRASLVKQRPLTTDEIVERQQRHRYLNQASAKARTQSMDIRDQETQKRADNAFQRQVTPSGQGKNEPMFESVEDMHSPRQPSKIHHESSKRGSQNPGVLATPTSTAPSPGTIVRWMKEAPTDPDFYMTQQILYHAARTSCLCREKSKSRRDCELIANMQASLRWSAPPLVKDVYSPIAIGESSTEKETPTLQSMVVDASSQLPETPLEPPPDARSSAIVLDIPEIPFAPCDQEELEDQEKKLRDKGVRNPAFVSRTIHPRTPIHPSQQNGPCLTPLRRSVREPKNPEREATYLTGQVPRPLRNSRIVQSRQGTPGRFKNQSSRSVPRPRGQRGQGRSAQTHWRANPRSHTSKRNESAMGH